MKDVFTAFSAKKYLFNKEYFHKDLKSTIFYDYSKWVTYVESTTVLNSDLLEFRSIELKVYIMYNVINASATYQIIIVI